MDLAVTFPYSSPVEPLTASATGYSALQNGESWPAAEPAQGLGGGHIAISHASLRGREFAAGQGKGKAARPLSELAPPFTRFSDHFGGNLIIQNMRP